MKFTNDNDLAAKIAERKKELSQKQEAKADKKAGEGK